MSNRAKLYLLEGEIIHVGEWDPQVEDLIDEETGEVVGTHDTNPLPDGVEVVEDGEYVKDAAGRIRLPSDYQALRRAEYPDWRDLADALYWQEQGDPAPMQTYLARCAEVKARHPKRS